MNDEIHSHEKCSHHGYMWEDGRYDENQPICYSIELESLVLNSPPSESLRSLEIVRLCIHGGSAVKLNDIGYCAECNFYPKQDEQEALFS